MKPTERVILSTAGTLSDLSSPLTDFVSQTALLPLAVGDYLYLSSLLPFNHRYVSVSVPNDALSTLSVQYWGGASQGWIAPSETIDETSDAAATLAQSGYVTWIPDYDKLWQRDDTIRITGLEAIKIRGLYWARLSVSVDLNPLTELFAIGSKFATDADLGSIYPDLVRAEVMGQFMTGKTSWEEQHFQAAEEIVTELESRNIILSKSQILDRWLFRRAGIHKLAEIIMNAFGKDYVENVKYARGYYKEAMAMTNYGVDSNEDAIQDEQDAGSQTRYMTR